MTPRWLRGVLQARDKTIAELLAMGQQCSDKLDGQDESQRAGKKKGKGRPMSDSGTKARFYHAVKDAHMAHVIKVDLKADLFSYTIDEDKKRYLELLDGKLLLVTNTTPQRLRWCSATRVWPILSRASRCSSPTLRLARCTTGCPSAFARMRWCVSWR